MYPEQSHETVVYNGRIRMPYNRAVGETGSFFFNELRSHERIWGSTCEECAIVFMPPRRSCPRCLHPHTGWQQLSSRGALVTFTIVRYHVPAIHPVEPPFALGIILLDGADTGLVHLLGETELDRLTEGMRVEAVFRKQEERTGSIMDIAYFKPHNVTPAIKPHA